VGLSNIIAIAATWHDSMVLRSDGTVVCWGDADFGETTTPVGLDHVVAISMGQNHCMALKFDLNAIRIENGEQGPGIRFNTFPGLPYTVEYSRELSSGGWLPLPSGSVQGTGTDVLVTDSSGPQGAPRFYRVKRPQ
jgi:hypothetical protein